MPRDSWNEIESRVDEQIEAALNSSQPLETQLPTLKRLTEKAAGARELDGLHEASRGSADLIFWVGALRKLVAEYSRDTLAMAEGRR